MKSLLNPDKIQENYLHEQNILYGYRHRPLRYATNHFINRPVINEG